MENIGKKIEAYFAAAAFAEAGERETALEIAGLKSKIKKRLSFDSVMTAITFAEAGVHKYALELMEKPEGARNRKPASLVLPGVKVYYGFATVTC